jgi:hypothetical protein
LKEKEKVSTGLNRDWDWGQILLDFQKYYCLHILINPVENNHVEVELL